MCFFVSNWQYCSIGSDNGLAPNRRQTINWTNVGMLYRRIYASLGPNELNWHWGMACLSYQSSTENIEIIT